MIIRFAMLKNTLHRLGQLVEDREGSQTSTFQEQQKLIEQVVSLIGELDENHEFKRVCDEMYDGVYIADGEGQTLYVNKAYSKITGLHPDDVLGKKVSDLMKQGLFKYAITPTILKEKKAINAMAEIHTGVNVLISGTPIFDEAGNIKRVVVINRDMTDLLNMQEKLEASKGEIEHLRKLQGSNSFIGDSEEVQVILQMIRQVASLDVTILILGETGTGKEVLSNEIYTNSNRKEKAFIKVNCAAIPANLLEAELFGYEPGAFTGASKKGKVGMFELADQGTLLLDEIGDMSIELQSKLLRVLQEKEITRLGGTKTIQCDVRIIAATNCDLQVKVKEGKFREDLYYRLSVFPITIPPLRERKPDIELLIRHYLEVYNQKYKKNIYLHTDAYDLCKRYLWPGNVRELRNIVERMVIISNSQQKVDAVLISQLLNIQATLDEDIEEYDLKEIVQKIEKQVIEKALKEFGSTRKAAEALKVSQSTVVKKAQKLGLK